MEALLSRRDSVSVSTEGGPLGQVVENSLGRPRLLAPWSRLALLAAVAIVLAGCGIRAASLFVGRALWIDEAMLANNIVNRDFGGLMRPLAHDQAAPRGFLFVEKAMTLVLGKGD